MWRHLSDKHSHCHLDDAKNDRTSVKQCRGCNRCSGSKRPINMSNKQAEEAVTPFLAKHVPKQYAPLGALSNYSDSDRETQKKGRSGADRLKERTEKPNTKYCYRHRPDLRCRRQADEPSMEQLQAVGFNVLWRWNFFSNTV